MQLSPLQAGNTVHIGARVRVCVSARPECRSAGRAHSLITARTSALRRKHRPIYMTAKLYAIAASVRLDGILNAQRQKYLSLESVYTVYSAVLVGARTIILISLKIPPALITRPTSNTISSNLSNNFLIKTDFDQY